jgi:hypothetical protein
MPFEMTGYVLSLHIHSLILYPETSIQYLSSNLLNQLAAVLP